MAVYIKNISGVEKVFRGHTLADSAYYLIADAERSSWAIDSGILQSITDDECLIAKSDDGTTDITDKAEQWNYLGNQVPPSVHLDATDADTQGIPVTNKFAPDGFYQRLHEVEFTTSTVGGDLHDKDVNNVDTGWSSIDFYEDIAGVETLMVSPTQGDLDTKCIRTDYKFMPDVDYMIKSGVMSHQEIPATEIYMWGMMLDVDPSLNVYGIFPIEVLSGGMAMSFVPARETVGLKGVNGTLLYYAGVMTPDGLFALPPGLGTNRIRYVMRHEAGHKHRFQSIYEIFRE